MEKPETYKITWRDEQVGLLVNPIPDMWYLEGKIEFFDNPKAENFKQILATLAPKDVMTNPSNGTRVTIHNQKNKEPINCLVYGLTDGLIFLRRYFKEEAVKWLLENVN